MSKKIIFVSVLALGLILGGAELYFYESQTVKVLSLEKAGTVSIDFINKALEQNNVTASLQSVTEESGVYKIHFSIENPEYGLQEYDTFLSKDGKYLFPQPPIDLEAEKAKEAQNQQPAAEQQPEATSGDQSEIAAEDASLADLAQCLTESGAKFYGASWCGHCQNQKAMFKTAVGLLPYVECAAADGSQTAVCTENNITGYPTWVFGDGTRQSGEIPLATLAEKTGCPLSQ